MKNKIVAIKLCYLPYGSIFRHNNQWWYHIRPKNPELDNAITASYETAGEYQEIPEDTLVAAHIDEVPKILAGKIAKVA